MMDTQEFMERVYSMLNAEGHGYAIGSPEQGLFGAIAANSGPALAYPLHVRPHCLQLTARVIPC
jgi:hypothetical protein